MTTDLTQLLHDVLTSRVYDVARETPLDPAPRLSRRLGNDVLLKREDLQPVFSFKLRGAYNKIAHLSQAERARGVIAASAGNHAQGVAFSARKLGLRAVIVMPQTTPQIKVDAVRALGAEVVLVGDSYAEAQAHCDTLVAADRHDVHPPVRRSAGHRRAGHDRRRDPAPQPGPPVGGVRAGRRRRADRRHRRLHQGAAAGREGHRRRAVRGRRDVPVAEAPDAACGSTTSASSPTASPCARWASGRSPIAQQTVDEVVRVTNDEICAAIKDVFDDTRSVMEPAGRAGRGRAEDVGRARGRAANQSLVAVLSGANMNFDRLRFVAERAELGEAREALLAVTIPERPGAFREFCAALGRRVGDRVQLPAERPATRRTSSSASPRSRGRTARRWRRS